MEAMDSVEIWAVNLVCSQTESCLKVSVEDVSLIQREIWGVWALTVPEVCWSGDSGPVEGGMEL